MLRGFPSPCGEDVMSTTEGEFKLRLEFQFPSPCGEDVMSTKSLSILKQLSKQVFPSPCGEDVMSTNLTKIILNSITISVSIPLRGRCNVNLLGWSLQKNRSPHGFPSPCGEDVMSTLIQGYGHTLHIQVSIPLRGRCNVNKTCGRASSHKLPATVSIPLRGRCNVNCYGFPKLWWRDWARFHPLAGKM